jgi:hypothetical protein
MGYRDDSTKNIATGNASEGEYAVLDGSHYDNGCCFDYGNAETNNDDDGDGTMEAINFGNETTWGYGTGSGPWIMADLENGLFSGAKAGYNSNDPTTSHRFTTAVIEGGANQWAILGGNADSGSLATDYSGARPSGYTTMKKQGAIILGIGGDNSDSSAGTFYEGVMTSGYPSAAAEASVQANIVSVGYANYTLPSNPFTSGKQISLQATTPCCTGDYLAGDYPSSDEVGADAVTSSSSSTVRPTRPGSSSPAWPTATASPSRRPTGPATTYATTISSSTWSRTTGHPSSRWTPHSAREPATAARTTRSCRTTTATSTSGITTTSATSPATAAPIPGTRPASGTRTPPGPSPPLGASPARS